MEKKWFLKQAINSTELEALRSSLKVDRIIATLLHQQGINSFEEAEDFFRPKLSDLHDPFLMKNMEIAVDRLSIALQNNERILLFGDYDVDGTTAVALLYSFLSQQTTQLEYYIPDRYSEGYGVSFKGIEVAAENNIGLIISLDCGIRSVDQVNYAKEKGIDFIVCDHHNPGEILPDCIVLDPKQIDCNYPFKELSGCGVGFKLAQGLLAKNNWDEAALMNSLDLLAVSIGADIVAVTGENRILCHHGMALLNAQPRPAFKALLKLAKRDFPVNLTDVVFTIAPRINAAGRLRSGKHAVELMITDDLNAIETIAEAINLDNTERKKVDQSMTAEALEIIANDIDFHQKKSTVVFKEDWHKGVVGIVASRLIEQHFRPTIVLTSSNGKATGSARTVNDFDIHAAIATCSHLLEQFGGHTHAAGLTLNLENVAEFQDAFEQYVQKNLTQEDLFPTQSIDLEISLTELFAAHENRMKIPRLKRILDQFEPFGPGNMKPVFLATNCYATDVKILGESHLKLVITQPNTDLQIPAIGFNCADKEELVAKGLAFDLAFTLETNTWKNKSTLQLNIKDLREHF
jgi:single-stranded-DNA-specific exonuclease